MSDWVLENDDVFSLLEYSEYGNVSAGQKAFRGRHRNTLLNPPPTPPPPIEIHFFLLFSRPLDPKYPMPISSRHCSKGTPTH